MIELRHLTKRFGEIPAVHDLSFNVKPGETFALLGPNGSGKTTTLKCVVGLMAPTSGQVIVEGIDGRKRAREASRLLSFLPQRVAFHENLTAREVLEFYCRLRKLPLNRIDQVLEKSNLNFNGFADRPVSEFSGGMIQRLGIAVAILPDAPILVLDEPTISLDPGGMIGFRQFMGVLKREGKTIVFSSHVLADIELLADRVAVLAAGRLLAVQSVQALRSELATSSRVRVVLLNPEERFVQAAAEAGATEARLVNDTLLVASKPDARLAILRAIQEAGALIERFSTEEPSLEEVYLRYVNEDNPAGLVADCGGMPDRASTAG